MWRGVNLAPAESLLATMLLILLSPGFWLATGLSLAGFWAGLRIGRIEPRWQGQDWWLPLFTLALALPLIYWQNVYSFVFLAELAMGQLLGQIQRVLAPRYEFDPNRVQAAEIIKLPMPKTSRVKRLAG